MNVRKILINFIRIMVILFLIVAVNRIFIPKYVSDNQDGRVTKEFYDVKTDLDMIALGSSTVYNGISPDYLYQQYGFASYIRSNASQTLWQSYYLLKDALRTKTPEVVLVDMSFMKYGEEFVEEPGNRKTIDGMRLSKDKYDCIKASMWEGEEPITYLFPVFRFHSRWKELTTEDFYYAFTEPQVTYQGYIMQFDVPEEQTVYEKEPKESYEFPEKAWLYLDKITELCKQKNIPLLLMKTPTYTNNWYDEYDELLTAYAEKNKISYVNFDWYKEEMGNNLRIHYVDDGSHLNNAGAENFSKFLGKYLTENYTMTDHRQDADFDRIWKNYVIRYETDKAEGTKLYEKRLNELGLK